MKIVILTILLFCNGCAIMGKPCTEMSTYIQQAQCVQDKKAGEWLKAGRKANNSRLLGTLLRKEEGKGN